ncbi:MAG: MurT ligase domain-containing protein [Lachnospirales bacterium]
MKDFYNLFVIYITKMVIFVMTDLLHRGSSFPGMFARKLNSDLLAYVSKGYKVVLITGTNGKTTTTSLIVKALKDSGQKVITNSSGANMYNGILTTFIKHYKSDEDKGYAIIEIDEANLKLVTPVIEPVAVCITNIFRDQLDRYGEVYTTMELILEGITSENTKLILNGDEPLFHFLKNKNEKIFFGFNAKLDNKIETNTEGCYCRDCNEQYSYKSVTYNHLGDYFCENCGYSRPDLTYSVDEILSQSANSCEVVIDEIKTELSIGGLYNIYNALCAYTVCKELGLESFDILESLKSQKSAFGRQEVIKFNNKELVMLLVKNPVGYNEAINSILLEDVDSSIAFVLNDNYADGCDVSWIWDVNFEKIDTSKYNKLYFAGIRRYDMAIRLQVTGVNREDILVVNTLENLLEVLDKENCEKVYVFTTYTAMLELRKLLHKGKHVNKLYS